MLLDAAPSNFFSYVFIWLRQVLVVARGDFAASWGIVAGHGLPYLQHMSSLAVAHELWSPFLAPVTVGNLIFIHTMRKKHLPRRGSVGFTPVPMQSTQCL